MSLAIQIRNLTLHRGAKQVLSNVSLSINAGEIVCLLGPSGSGKSSLLRCVNRLTEPPTDSVYVSDKDVTALDVLALRRRVGMVFQQVALFSGSVGDNVAYGVTLQKRSLTRSEIDNFLNLADLPPSIADQDSQTLSGGQAQRVAIARALATKPDILLLDEATSALDPAATRHIEETMLKLRRELGLTLFWVTHSAEQAQRVADRLYLLADGQVVDEGIPTHLLGSDSTHLTAAFAAGELD